jgi:hypothetical protein
MTKMMMVQVFLLLVTGCLWQVRGFVMPKSIASPKPATALPAFSSNDYLNRLGNNRDFRDTYTANRNRDYDYSGRRQNRDNDFYSSKSSILNSNNNDYENRFGNRRILDRGYDNRYDGRRSLDRGVSDIFYMTYQDCALTATLLELGSLQC